MGIWTYRVEELSGAERDVPPGVVSKFVIMRRGSDWSYVYTVEEARRICRDR